MEPERSFAIAALTMLFLWCIGETALAQCWHRRKRGFAFPAYMGLGAKWIGMVAWYGIVLAILWCMITCA